MRFYYFGYVNLLINKNKTLTLSCSLSIHFALPPTQSKNIAICNAGHKRAFLSVSNRIRSICSGDVLNLTFISLPLAEIIQTKKQIFNYHVTAIFKMTLKNVASCLKVIFYISEVVVSNKLSAIALWYHQMCLLKFLRRTFI